MSKKRLDPDWEFEGYEPELGLHVPVVHGEGRLHPFLRDAAGRPMRRRLGFRRKGEPEWEPVDMTHEQIEELEELMEDHDE